MKIKFDPNQIHQKRAWEAVCSVFEGQELCKSAFSMPSIPSDGGLEKRWSNQTDKGYGNRLKLIDEEILNNVRTIQLKNGLKQSGELQGRNFTVEMETGTGKTYVYLRSIFEMNKLYGFSKFIIVVPGIAIKEGVFKSLEMTKDHFKELYDNVPVDYFFYDSSKLEQVRSFAANDCIQVMVINIDAFRKSFSDPSKETTANIIHRWNDKMQGVPIDFIQSTNPIVIIDEPQSVDTTDKSSQAIKSLNPLCTFRYSATHTKKHNMLYKLDSIDAYEQKLVKQIEVASIQVKDGDNKAYIKLLEVDNKKGHRAKIELSIQQNTNVKKITKWVKQGDDLLTISNGRTIYDGYIINDIYCEEGNEYIDFTSKTEIIRLNQAIGEVNEDEYKRLQIRKTIEEHLNRELKLTPLGIKVLSLFFIDRVANYRDYSAPNEKGKYAVIFEEEYSKLIKKPKYNNLFKELDVSTLATNVHNGYFSADKGRAKDTRGDTKADEDTYGLIMRDKEKLLSFDSKLKFIFSHSALKEGWDNPNVFQICTLNETGSIIKKRQEIGRGLRICVNQDGQRVHGFDVNTLTVMANESYESFVDGLQKEIEKEENIRFGVVEEHLFANLVFLDEKGEDKFLGAESSENIWKHLLIKAYIKNNGKIEDSLKKALKEENVDLPDEYLEHSNQIISTLKKVAGVPNIKNNDDKRTIRLNKAVFESPEFKELWDRIKYKTIYNVEFDPQELIKKCAESVKKNLIVGKTRFNYTRAKTEISKGGVNVTESQESNHLYDARDYEIPDILSYLQNETNLKRESILNILLDSGRLEDFKNNPQKFIDGVKELIKREMRRFIVNGIKYHKIGNDHFYAQEMFESEELNGYLNKNMIEATKSTYDHVIHDSNIESSLAKSFEKNEEVKVYTKLPSWFKIETPLGSYNPDWAVLIEQDGKDRLYFVVETKGDTSEGMLPDSQKGKIDCGRKHFEALGEDARYMVASNYETFFDQAMGASHVTKN
jgi:type III restriction enzyme